MLFNMEKSWVSIYCPSLSECLELTIGLQVDCNFMSVTFSCRQAQRREDEDKRRETHSSKKKGKRHISKSWIHILIVNWFELVSS